ncbi:MAG: glycosyltransferase [bacterium]|nr:glycosyltransferase [bacterium]
MRILQIGADRSRRGILYRGTPAFMRQEAYAKQFGNLDIIALSLRSDGAEIIDAGALRVYPTNAASKLSYFSRAMQIARTLPKPAVVSVQDPFETGLLGWRIARKFKVPLHVQIHTDFLSKEYARHSFMNRLRVLVAGFVLRRASHIRVVSEKIKTSLLKKYRLHAPVTVLPIFVDVESFRNARIDESLAERFSSFKPKLLVVSRLESEKNVALALRAFAECAPQDACLLIVGEGSEKTQLLRMAEDLGVSGRVFFKGAKAPIEYYKLADLVLVPSLYEGYGMVAIEALASGVPVLSTDVGIAREAGAIIAPREKFAEALADWFKNGPSTGESADFVARPAATTGGPQTVELKNYPYKSFGEYVEAYCNDIVSSA